MKKTHALALLGGPAAAADKLGISYQAVTKWPDVLPPRIADRVVAAVARQHMPRALAKLIDEPARVA